MARPEKVAVVEEIREKLAGSDAAVLAEYRGLKVGELAELRGALRPAGAEFKIFKNTLARRAAEEAGLTDLVPMLLGPTAIAFVNGDAVIAAKALRDFAKAHEALDRQGRPARRPHADAARPRRAWPTSPPRDVLLARLAGGFQAPMVKAAGLFQAFTRNLAYGIKALVDQRVEGGEALEAPRRARAPKRRAAEAPQPPTRPRPTPGAGRRGARRRGRRPRPRPPRPRPKTAADRDRTHRGRVTEMPTTEELLDTFKNMTVLELNDFLKAFEEEFGVTAAAPVAVAAAAGGGGGGEAAAAEEKDEFDVVLVGGRRQEDPGHQGGPVAHEPRAQGGQGPGRLGAEARPREGRQGRGREGQGPARRGRRHRRAQVVQQGRGFGPRLGDPDGRRRPPDRPRSAVGRRRSSAMQCLTPEGVVVSSPRFRPRLAALGRCACIALLERAPL